jgi:hypothetical protein
LCLLCGRALLAGGTIQVSPEGLAIHKGTCHQLWMRAGGYERVRLIDRGRAAAGQRKGHPS